MKLVKPTFDIITPESYDITSVLKFIELCGRTCYRSESSITENSYQGFIERMLKSKHLSVLEHGTIYLKKAIVSATDYLYVKYKDNPYSKTNIVSVDTAEGKEYVCFITTNYRVIAENDWYNDLILMCAPTQYHNKRITVKFLSNIHFYKDITRHRTASFSIESTRYCNYTNDKFDKCITFVDPVWCNYEFYDSFFGLPDSETAIVRPDEDDKEDTAMYHFYNQLKSAEETYFTLINLGWTAQEAAEILPQDTAAEVVMTAYDCDWLHIMKLRALEETGAPHPEVKRLFEPLYREFINNNII